MDSIDNKLNAVPVKIVGVDGSGEEDNFTLVGTNGRLKTDALISNDLNSPLPIDFLQRRIDAFGRLRVSNPTTIFESTFHIDKQPLLWTESTSGGATVIHNSNTSSVDIILPTTSGAKAIFQTKQYFAYHPGKSQFILLSGNIGGAAANVRKRIGQFDDNNGFIFELNETVARVILRSNTSGVPVDTAVDQVNWNIDKLDGTGSSGHTLDISKQNILFFDYQWLGSGRVRFGAVIDGEIIIAHEFYNANSTLTVPYIKTAILPIRIESENLSTSAGSTGHLTCAAIVAEGGFGPEGIIRSANNAVTSKSIPASGITPILSIRKQSAYSRLPIKLIGISAFANSTDDLLIRVTINGTLTGPSWSNLTGIAQQDVAATVVSGGTDIFSFYLRGAAGAKSTEILQELLESSNIILGSDFTGNSDIVTISAQSLTGLSNGYATIIYKELI